MSTKSKEGLRMSRKLFHWHPFEVFHGRVPWKQDSDLGCINPVPVGGRAHAMHLPSLSTGSLHHSGCTSVERWSDQDSSISICVSVSDRKIPETILILRQGLNLLQNNKNIKGYFSRTKKKAIFLSMHVPTMNIAGRSQSKQVIIF